MEENTFNKLSDRRYLYRISQIVNHEYDTYDSAIVAAWSADEATKMHPACPLWNDITTRWLVDYDVFDWCDPEDVTTELIGIAEPGIVGVICSSFNAG